MYIRHLAWLSAKPEGLKKSRLKTFVEKFKIEPDMPPMDGCEYLIEYLQRIGMVMNTGMGQSNLTYAEIDAWCNRTKVDLKWWESEAIFNLSRAYASQLEAAKDKLCEPPYQPYVKQHKNSESLDDGILKAFEKLANSSKTKRKTL